MLRRRRRYRIHVPRRQIRAAVNVWRRLRTGAVTVGVRSGGRRRRRRDFAARFRLARFDVISVC